MKIRINVNDKYDKLDLLNRVLIIPPKTCIAKIYHTKDSKNPIVYIILTPTKNLLNDLDYSYNKKCIDKLGFNYINKYTKRLGFLFNFFCPFFGSGTQDPPCTIFKIPKKVNINFLPF